MLLKKLKEHKCFETLPSDTRTVVKTPRNIPVKSVGNGTYSHVGLDKCLKQLISKYPELKGTKVLDLQINVDGIPIAKSAGSQLWPILGAFTYFEHII